MSEFGQCELVFCSSESDLAGGGGMLAIPPLFDFFANGWSSSESDHD